MMTKLLICFLCSLLLNLAQASWRQPGQNTDLVVCSFVFRAYPMMGLHLGGCTTFRRMALTCQAGHVTNARDALRVVQLQVRPTAHESRSDTKQYRLRGAKHGTVWQFR